MSLDDVRNDPSIPSALRKELIAYYEVHGSIPPRRRWHIIFGADYEPEPKNRWMLR